MSFLPAADREYLDEKGLGFEEVAIGEQKAIILKGLVLPGGRYSVSTVDVLVLLPSGYPDVRPDMFHTLPWVKLLPEDRYPKAADQAVNFNGQSWQRWSRHSDDWRPGRDGIRTVLKRVEHALEEAQA